MVLSSVGGLSEISLLPFHHLRINNKHRNSHNNHHFLSIGGLCQQQQSLQFQTTKKKKDNRNDGNGFFIFCCSTEISDDISTSNESSSSSSSSMEESSATATEAEASNDTSTMEEESSTTTTVAEATAITNPAPLRRKKKIRYRKEYPGENKGIVEEMRFVAMRLHNKKKKRRIRTKPKEKSNDEEETLEEEEEEASSSDKDSDNDSEDDGETLEPKVEEEEEESQESSLSSDKNGDAETWQPSIEGFIKYLVDSKLVFETLERIIDESDNISYTYFRNTGLERSAGLAKDLEWFHQQNNVIPEPSKYGVDYARYLEEVAAKSVPMFLCHYYNIHFAHISGGQVIAKQASEKALEGRELEFNTWEGDALELLKNVRVNLNNLGERWTRDEKNRCLKEASKSFQYLGQIVRLIIS